MILYINGDSHSTGSQAVNNHCFAEDDSTYWQLIGQRKPHPDNLAVSFGNQLAIKLDATLICQAEAAGSNDRIIRTTKNFLKTNRPDLIVIGWSTWEREEWFDIDKNIYYQVNCSGTDRVPKKWQYKYKKFIANIDYKDKTIANHEKIWNFHLFLEDQKIPHLFFNCYNHFFQDGPYKIEKYYEWGNSYIGPYEKELTYYFWLVNQNIQPRVSDHFGPDGHTKWADFLLPHLTALL